MNLKTIKDRLVSLLKDKSSGIQSEFQSQLIEILKRIEELLIDNHGECEIPDELLKEIARCLLPDIIKFLESDKGKEEFEKWKSNQEFDKREGNIYHNKKKTSFFVKINIFVFVPKVLTFVPGGVII